MWDDKFGLKKSPTNSSLLTGDESASCSKLQGCPQGSSKSTSDVVTTHVSSETEVQESQSVVADVSYEDNSSSSTETQSFDNHLLHFLTEKNSVLKPPQYVKCNSVKTAVNDSTQGICETKEPSIQPKKSETSNGNNSTVLFEPELFPNLAQEEFAYADYADLELSVQIQKMDYVPDVAPPENIAIQNEFDNVFAIELDNDDQMDDSSVDDNNSSVQESAESFESDLENSLSEYEDYQSDSQEISDSSENDNKPLVKLPTVETGTSTSPSDQFTQLHSVFKKLRKNRENGVLCDVVIIVEGKEFPCHKVVLTSQSPYFETMFTGSFIEAHAKEITIKEISSKGFEHVLHYLYGSPIEDRILPENVQDILMTADMLCIDPVVHLCRSYLNEICSTFDRLIPSSFVKHLTVHRVSEAFAQDKAMIMTRFRLDFLKELIRGFERNVTTGITLLTAAAVIIKTYPHDCLYIAREFFRYISFEKIPEFYVDSFFTFLKTVTNVSTLRTLITISNDLRYMGIRDISVLKCLQIIAVDCQEDIMYFHRFDFNLWKWVKCFVYFKIQKGYELLDPKLHGVEIFLFENTFGKNASSKISLTQEEIKASFSEDILSSISGLKTLDLCATSEGGYIHADIQEFPGCWSYIVLNRITKANPTGSDPANDLKQANKNSIDILCCLPHFCSVQRLLLGKRVRIILCET